MEELTPKEARGLYNTLLYIVTKEARKAPEALLGAKGEKMLSEEAVDQHKMPDDHLTPVEKGMAMQKLVDLLRKRAEQTS